MNELNEMWSRMLSQAIENARASGRGDVVEYLTLKAANDAMRQIGVRWLFDTLVEIAGEANRINQSISIERTDPYNFNYRSANLLGSLFKLRQGVRCLSVEAGWTRTPTDGFIRGGALAIGRITHLGMSNANAEISLVKTDEGPVWKLMSDQKAAEIFGSDAMRDHFRIFAGN